MRVLVVDDDVKLVRLIERGRDLELTVRDEGPGIPPGLRATAFERFTRADAAREQGGAGLGLAIVAAVARAHDGEASIGPEGEVRLRLPLAVAGLQERAARATATEPVR